MAAESSYSEKLSPYVPQSLAPTIQQVTDSEPHYTFFGVDPRSELSQLNSRFYRFFDGIKDLAIGKQLAKYATDAVDGVAGAPVMVVPVAAGAAGHGVARIPALSLAVFLMTIQVLSSDYTSVFSTLQQARACPGFPSLASIFQLLPKDPSLKFKSPFHIKMEVIAATFISSMRPMMIHSNQARMTALWFFMRDENQAENMFIGTDALNGVHPVPPSRTTNLAHLLPTATVAQQLAALHAFILDLSTGVGDLGVLAACFTEYDKLINLLMKHSDFQPIMLNRNEGGLPIRLLNYQLAASMFTAYSYLNTEEITLDLAEIGTMFYKPESHAPPAVAPARRGGYFPIDEQDALQTAIVARTIGTNDNFWNTGPNVDISSMRIAAIYLVATLDRDAWLMYVYQRKAIPFSSSLPKTAEDHTTMIREKLALKRKAQEMYDAERMLRIKSELKADLEAERKRQALDSKVVADKKPDNTSDAI